MTLLAATRDESARVRARMHLHQARECVQLSSLLYVHLLFLYHVQLFALPYA